MGSTLVTPSSLTLNVGQTWQITASTTPSDAVVLYVSSDSAKVTVSSAGVIRAVAPGIATVTLSASKAGFIAGVRYIEVTVTAPAVSLSNTSSGIGKVATVTLSGYAGAAQYKLLKADGTALTNLVDVGSTAVVMFLNPGDQCKN